MKHPTKHVVLMILVCTLVSLSFACLATAQSTLVKAEASSAEPQIGDTLTVTVKVANAQNLFGVDVTLNWDPSVLELTKATPQLGVESHSGGVLHESTTYPIEIVDNTGTQSSGEYHLAATSTGSSTSAFSGDGTIVTLTFTVTSAGQTGLCFGDVEFSVRSGSEMDLVTPQTEVTTVNAVPEFPALIVVGLAATVVTAVVISTKLLQNKASFSAKAAPAF
ncbi:MAG: cohesin domain-containing protein [Candidatus Bathyarchaeota archaeon]|nr:cohesin domain-containing protein [Candidatus Bathyarchaeota archaeon]